MSEEDLTLMKLIDRQYLSTPFSGARRMVAWLKKQGYGVNRKRVRRLMRVMGLKAIYRRHRVSVSLMFLMTLAQVLYVTSHVGRQRGVRV